MKYLFIGIVSVVIISCTNKQETDNLKDELPFVEIGNALEDRGSNTKSLAEFIDTIKYIPLETNPQSNIEEIQKIICYKRNYYTWDYNAILKFNSNGKFVCEIGKRGRGPKEYSRNREMTIRSDTLYINEGRKIVAYSANDGSFFGAYPFPNRWFFERIEGQFVTINANTGFTEFIDDKGSVTDSLNYEHFTQSKIYPDMMTYPLYDAFFGTTKSLKISTSHNDTLFEINNRHQLVPRYILDMGNYKLQDADRLEYSGDFDRFDKITPKFVRPIPLETSRFLIIQFGKWGTVSNFPDLGFRDKKADLTGFGIFDKHTGEFSVISKDEENYPFFFPHFSNEENGLVTWVDAIDAIDFYNENKDKHNFCNPFTITVKSLNIEDNPVIVEVTLKE